MNCFFPTSPLLLHVCSTACVYEEARSGTPMTHTVVILSFWDGFLCIALAVLELPTQGRDWRPHLAPTYFFETFLTEPGVYYHFSWMDWPASTWGPPISAFCVGTAGTHCHAQLLCGCCAPHPGSHDTAAISRPSSSNSLNRVNYHLLSFSQPKILNMSSRKLPLTSKTISIYLWIYRTSQWPQTAAHNL